MDKPITRETTVHVPYSFMEHAAEHISCAHLDMHNPKRSHAKVFQWQGKTWTGTGTASRHHKFLQVEIREVVPVDRYTGPQPDSTKRGPDFYLGGTFKWKGQTWAMTDNKVILIPDDTPPSAKPEQLSLFGA